MLKGSYKIKEGWDKSYLAIFLPLARDTPFECISGNNFARFIFTCVSPPIYSILGLSLATGLFGAGLKGNTNPLCGEDDKFGTDLGGWASTPFVPKKKDWHGFTMQEFPLRLVSSQVCEGFV